MSTEAKEKRTRKTKARHYAVVLAALQERLNCIVQDDVNAFHIVRMNELFDEMNRSLGSKSEPEDVE